MVLPGATVMAEAVAGWLEVLYVLILLCVYNEVLFDFGIVCFSLKVPKYIYKYISY